MLTSPRLVQDKGNCKKQENKPGTTEFWMVNYTLTLSHHHPPCWKHLIKFIALFLQPLVTVTHIPSLSSTAALLPFTLLFRSSVKLQISCETTHLRKSQKSGQLQDHSKSYTRAICILRKIQSETLPETPPICPANPFFRVS